ncbi:Pyridoxal phosphate-dependent transferase major region subdomain 1 [Penicillium hetheringtonii]|uniref:Pyridoxal phosphate-dependent transferase major region subdomain 1 n=1 Tax=Penicillium hetheringtonii TaxID=911720 RepID=A0AAD6DYC3_9EURO|nr:Pyridoxal phosphate-dependent transferase major region subdomain 1 [Penicillium hetheringtonii]
MSGSNENLTPFGHEMKKHFSFQDGYRNLNHGSFGASPKAIRALADRLREECESAPCPFIKYEFPLLLNESRSAASTLLNSPLSDLVFVANATTGVNTVLRNIIWNPDGLDEILYLDVIYGACGKTVHYLYAAIISGFRRAIEASRKQNRRPRIAIFDTITSNPAMKLPFEQLTALCHAEGVLSLIDGAHGIGQIELNLATLSPDFFVTNCHKWLLTPRSCAILYVPKRHQAMMRSTLPTSHGFVPWVSTLEKNQQSFVSNFEFVGTADNLAFLTVAEAISWRKTICGGEDQIREYCIGLARKGGRRVAEILGTSVLDNDAHTLTECFMVNVLLPLRQPTSGEGSRIMSGDFPGATVTDWMQKTMIKEYKTFMPVFAFQGSWWVRLSGQIYLEDSDFEWAGWRLKELCARLQD